MNNLPENSELSDLSSDLYSSSTDDDISKTLLENIGKQIDSSEQTGHSSATSSLPPIFEYLPELIHEMYNKGIGFSIENTGEVTVKDFYRPSTIKMSMNGDDSFSIELRKENFNIKSLDDLIDLNYREWKKTGKGRGSYDTPAKCWTDLFAEKGLIKRQVVFIPTDD